MCGNDAIILFNLGLLTLFRLKLLKLLFSMKTPLMLGQILRNASPADRIRITSLRSKINNMKQGSKSVLEYFTEMKTLWEELNSHRPMPHCTCPHPCRCTAMREARCYRLEDQVIQFLTGLNDQFNVVKTQVLMPDPLIGFY